MSDSKENSLTKTDAPAFTEKEERVLKVFTHSYGHYTPHRLTSMVL